MEWVKALHVISVIAWMAGMMYLPRLFVYHADAAVGSDKSETFKVMERRLYRGITTPAMIATWIFGLWMVFSGIVDWSMGWPYLKAAMVIALSGIHGFYGRLLRDFANDQQHPPGQILPDDQRDPVRHRHRHRHRGDRETVLAAAPAAHSALNVSQRTATSTPFRRIRAKGRFPIGCPRQTPSLSDSRPAQGPNPCRI